VKIVGSRQSAGLVFALNMSDFAGRTTTVRYE